MAVNTIRGATGQVLWGYRQVASIGPWSFEGERSGGTLTGTIVSVDAFMASQGPLTFVVPRPGKAWRWPIRPGTLQIAGPTLTAALGTAGDT